jgi:hypothetical protein
MPAPQAEESNYCIIPRFEQSWYDREVIWPYYVYALSYEMNGLRRYFYVGGAYGNARRMFVHGPKRGAKSARKVFRVMERAGIEIDRRILALYAKGTVLEWERWWWDALVRLGHPVVNERPQHYFEGHKHSDASRKRTSDTIRSSAVYAEAMSNPERGKRISVALKGRPKSPEHCASISRSKSGVPHRPTGAEGIVHLKQGTQAAWDDPEKKAARLEKRRVTHQKNGTRTGPKTKTGRGISAPA